MKRLLFAAMLTLGACSNDAPGCPDGSTCSDAAADVVVPFANFSVSVSRVVLDPGDTHDVVVLLDHNGSGSINVTIEGLPSGVTVSPLDILVGSPGGKLKLTADASITVPQDVDVTVRADSLGAPSLTAPLHVRIGSVFHVATTSESFQVPSNVTDVVFQVWGAGGGAGGGLGGGGGFATTQIPVTGGETLAIVVGGGGLAKVGGGYSAVMRGTDVLVIAGGGGGGGSFAGGGGGGGQGENGGGPCGGGGGTDAGGGSAGGANAEAGASLFGGGGAPNGGGGGFGYFGGGGGGLDDAGFGCGGGGGSAFVTPLGSSSKLLGATGQNPAGNTVVGYGDSGAATGGALADGGQPVGGAAGLVVARYPK